jgi:hypothetical protein
MVQRKRRRRSLEFPISECSKIETSEKEAGKGPDDFIFTRVDGEPIKDFRDAWWKACLAAGVGRFVCGQCGELVRDKKCRSCGGEREYKGPLFHDLRRTGVRT